VIVARALSWNVSVDQAFFLDGLGKADLLEVFQPDFFFDDQLTHIHPVKEIICAGHVPSGVANQ
jgi:5'-nucleotidase